jgi:hypothetical protein
LENNTYIIERANKILKICENASRDTLLYSYIDKSVELLSFYSTEKEINKKNLLSAIKISKKILSLNDTIEEGYTLSIEAENIDINTNIDNLKIIKSILKNDNIDIKEESNYDNKNMMIKEERAEVNIENDVEYNYDIETVTIEKQENTAENIIVIEDLLYIKIFNSINTALKYKVDKDKITFNYIIDILHIDNIYTNKDISYVEQLNKFFIYSKEIIYLPGEIKELEIEKKNILENTIDNNINQDIRRKLLSIEGNLKSFHKHKLFLIEEINLFINIKRLLKDRHQYDIKIRGIYKYVLFSSLVLNAYMIYLINNYIFILTNQY